MINLTRYRSASESEIDALEKAIGHRFPDDYRQFLREYDGAVPESNQFSATGEVDFEAGVQFFISVLDFDPALPDELELYPGELPIAEEGGGNYVVLDAKSGRVRFWHHEYPSDVIFHVADSFSGFLKCIEPWSFDPSEFASTETVVVDFPPGWERFRSQVNRLHRAAEQFADGKKTGLCLAPTHGDAVLRLYRSFGESQVVRSPDEVEISAALTADLLDFGRWWQQTHEIGTIQDPRFESLDDRRRFVEAGESLAGRVQEELGDGYEVWFDSQGYVDVPVGS